MIALQSLVQEHEGGIGCIYIDPPYNTGSAFPEYDDGIEHSLWLTHIRDRLTLLWRLLRSDRGVLLISINDDEAHYLKVLCDELFGRGAFKATLIWNTEGNTDNQSKIIRYHEYILVYAKGELPEPGVIDPNTKEDSKLNKDEIRNTIVKNGPKNPISVISIPAGMPANFERGTLKARDDRWPHILDDVVVENYKTQNEGRFRSGWSSKDICLSFIANNFQPVRDSKGQQTAFEVTRTGAIEGVKVREQKKGHFISVLRGFGTTNQMRIMLGKLGVSFSFAKPLGLIEYLIQAFSGPDDVVLDSYAGSGTTAHAVMSLNKKTGSNRKFIVIEQFDKTVREILLPRLRAAILGHDGAEIPEHGGGFRYYRLAPSLLEKDRWGNWVISQNYNPTMMAEAVCKLMNFTYDPSETHYWMHGRSSERDFIYVTTQSLTHDQLRAISEEVGEDRSLLVCCKAFNAKPEAFANLTINKIPQTVLRKCEWGKDDYSLNVSNLLMAELAADEPPVRSDQGALFGEEA